MIFISPQKLFSFSRYLMYFPPFGLNTEIYRANLRIQSESGKIRPRKTPNKDTFGAVVLKDSPFIHDRGFCG